jgi:hypothetical protein
VRRPDENMVVYRRARRKFVAGVVVAALLLLALALMNGPNAGADVSSQFTTVPTISATVSCDGTTGTWVATYTLTSESNAGFWLYPDGGAPTSGVLHGLPATITGAGTVTFTVDGIANGTAFIQVDVLAYSDAGWNDLYSNVPITGVCEVTPTTTTTVAPVTPITPALPGAGPPKDVAPATPPPLPVLAAPAVVPAVQPPLAFTGLDVLPLLVSGGGLIVVGGLMLVLRRRLA